MNIETAILSKLIFLSCLHSGLFFLYLHLKSFKIFHIIFLILIYFFLTGLINFFFWENNYKTFYIFNASLITITYFELSVILEKYFFRDFLGNSLPYLINYIISLTLMINVAYFTLMIVYNVFG